MLGSVRRSWLAPSVLSPSVLASLALLLFATANAAGDEKKPLPVADLSRVDADFAYQGEFEGKLPADDPNGRVVALQVRANGKGRFQAIQFDHGLPGESPQSKRLAWLSGKRYEELLVLSGGPWAVLVHPEHCLLLDGDGQPVGKLARVHRESPTLGAAAPKQATVLFDGSSIDQFVDAKLTDAGLLMQGTNLLTMYQDFDLHLEFVLPYMPASNDQGRANSGLYIQSRYEVQILDSFALSTTFNGCGSIYRFRKPDVNMCLPPLVWQTYDISFTAPRWGADGKKLKNARITVWHNGVKVQDHVEIPNKTGHGAPEEVALLPIKLQEHGAPVRFRNIWIVDRGADGWVDFPVYSTEEQKAQARTAPGALCRPAAPPAAPQPAAPEAKPAEAAPAEPKPSATPAAEAPAPAAAPAPEPAPAPAAAPAPTADTKTS